MNEAMRASRRWRSNAVRLFVFLLVLSLEASFNVGILIGRYRWKNDMPWVHQVLVVMSLTLAVLLWALYRQASIVSRGYLANPELANPQQANPQQANGR